ncbi:MAG: aromatic acid exporter family protein, partial [Clostridium sporogenes]|nr:aromatic acid exporter family protein [Clostridium sporogenes]
YYAAYMEMRIQQFETLKKMRQHFQKFFMTYEQTEMIADFTKNEFKKTIDKLDYETKN